jgi:hypothetical protein
LVDLNETKMKWDDNMVHGHPVGFLRATNSDVEVTGSTFVESGPLVPPPWPPSRQDDPAELQAECRNIVADLNELVEGHRDDLMDVYESTMAARVKAFYLRSRANGYWYEWIERKYDSPLGLNSGGVLGLARAMEEFVAAFDSPPDPKPYSRIRSE